MKTLTIRVSRPCYNVLSGIGWAMFWPFFVFFLGVALQWWTLESESAHWWWIASAVIITIARPFKTFVIRDVTIPLKDNPPP